MTASAARQVDSVVDPSDLEERRDGAASTAATIDTWQIEVFRPSRQITVGSRRRVVRTSGSEPDYRARALALWPRLDADKLRRTRGDVMRIARLVEPRTSCSIETIIGMLTRESNVARDD
jgi:hypothetical protein